MVAHYDKIFLKFAIILSFYQLKKKRTLSFLRTLGSVLMHEIKRIENTVWYESVNTQMHRRFRKPVRRHFPQVICILYLVALQSR